MKLCVELYAKNPHVLDPLRKFIYLPSNRTIRYVIFNENKTQIFYSNNYEYQSYDLKIAEKQGYMLLKDRCSLVL